MVPYGEYVVQRGSVEVCVTEEDFTGMIVKKQEDSVQCIIIQVKERSSYKSENCWVPVLLS